MAQHHERLNKCPVFAMLYNFSAGNKVSILWCRENGFYGKIKSPLQFAASVSRQIDCSRRNRKQTANQTVISTPRYCFKIPSVGEVSIYRIKNCEVCLCSLVSVFGSIVICFVCFELKIIVSFVLRFDGNMRNCLSARLSRAMCLL